MTILLFFDVETSGLLPNTKSKTLDLKNLDQYPHILQLSYILYDLDRNMVIEKYNAYIHNTTVDVLPEITELTGITKELMMEKGVCLDDALESFKCSYLQCNFIIAHNFEFDSKMLVIETERNRDYLQPVSYSILSSIMSNTNIKSECTMQMTVDFCNIERINSRGVYKKLPRLSELYQKLFDTNLKNFHNSMIDVLACLRCYLKFKYDYLIEETVFQKMIDEYIG